MAPAPLLPVTLSCNTDLRFIDLIQVVGSELLKHMSFTHEDGERLWLAIQEGIANAMRHGNQLQKDKPVKVTFTPRSDRFEIRIEDRGPGVDLDTLPVDNNFFRSLKKQNPDLYIMCLSSRTHHPALQEAMGSHIYASLAKPLNVEELFYWLKIIAEI